MNRKRLQILKRALLAFKVRSGNAKFDLESWVGVPREYIDEVALKVLKAAIAGKNYCGTTACACGLAATIPSFKRDGFKLLRSVGNTHASPKFRRYSQFSAPREFFDLTNHETIWLFCPDEYTRRARRDPAAVVKRIDALLAGKVCPVTRDISGYQWGPYL